MRAAVRIKIRGRDRFLCTFLGPREKSLFVMHPSKNRLTNSCTYRKEARSKPDLPTTFFPTEIFCVPVGGSSRALKCVYVFLPLGSRFSTLYACLRAAVCIMYEMDESNIISETASDLPDFPLVMNKLFFRKFWPHKGLTRSHLPYLCFVRRGCK